MVKTKIVSLHQTNKKTAEEGKNVKKKKSNDAHKKNDSDKTGKRKTSERSDVNSDVDEE